jgi:hypothetical protein
MDKPRDQTVEHEGAEEQAGPDQPDTREIIKPDWAELEDHPEIACDDPKKPRPEESTQKRR